MLLLIPALAVLGLLFAVLLLPFATRGVQGMTNRRRALIGLGIAVAVPVALVAVVLVIGLGLAFAFRY